MKLSCIAHQPRSMYKYNTDTHMHLYNTDTMGLAALQCLSMSHVNMVDFLNLSKDIHQHWTRGWSRGHHCWPLNLGAFDDCIISIDRSTDQWNYHKSFYKTTITILIACLDGEHDVSNQRYAMPLIITYGHLVCYGPTYAHILCTISLAKNVI